MSQWMATAWSFVTCRPRQRTLADLLLSLQGENISLRAEMMFGRGDLNAEISGLREGNRRLLELVRALRDVNADLDGRLVPPCR